MRQEAETMWAKMDEELERRKLEEMEKLEREHANKLVEWQKRKELVERNLK